MAYCVSLGSMTGTLKRGELAFSSFISNLLLYFPLFSTLGSVLSLYISFLGDLKLSQNSYFLPVVTHALRYSKFDPLPQKFRQRNFWRELPFAEYLLCARHCAQNFTFIVWKSEWCTFDSWKKLKLREVKSAGLRSVGREGRDCNSLCCPGKCVLSRTSSTLCYRFALHESPTWVSGRQHLLLVTAENCPGWKGFSR